METQALFFLASERRSTYAISGETKKNDNSPSFFIHLHVERMADYMQLFAAIQEAGLPVAYYWKHWPGVYPTQAQIKRAGFPDDVWIDVKWDAIGFHANGLLLEGNPSIREVAEWLRQKMRETWKEERPDIRLLRKWQSSHDENDNTKCKHCGANALARTDCDHALCVECCEVALDRGDCTHCRKVPTNLTPLAE